MFMLKANFSIIILYNGTSFEMIICNAITNKEAKDKKTH